MSIEAHNSVLPRLFMQDLAMRCALVLAAGLALAAVLLYAAFHQELGPTYQESFRMLSRMREAVLVKSLFVFGAAMAVTVAGTVWLALIYSHRVAGPVYRLTQVARQVAAGDLSPRVTLRRHDAVQPLADHVNGLIEHQRDTVCQLAQVSGELEALADLLKGVEQGSPAYEEGLAALRQKTAALGRIMERVTL